MSNMNTLVHAVGEVFRIRESEFHQHGLLWGEYGHRSLAGEFDPKVIPLVNTVNVLSFCQFVSHGLTKDTAVKALNAMQRGVFVMASKPSIQAMWDYREEHGWQGFPVVPGDGVLHSAFMWQLLDNKTIRLGMVNYNRTYDYVNDVVHGTDTHGGKEWADTAPTWPRVTTSYHTMQLYSALIAAGTGDARVEPEDSGKNS